MATKKQMDEYNSEENQRKIREARGRAVGSTASSQAIDARMKEKLAEPKPDLSAGLKGLRDMAAKLREINQKGKK